MKIRIVQSGYETFNGLLGDVKFENGLSVTDVTKQQMDYVGAMFVVAREDEPVEGPVDPIVQQPPVEAPEAPVEEPVEAPVEETKAAE